MGILNRREKVPQTNNGQGELDRIAKETGLAPELVADVMESAANGEGGWQLGNGEIKRT